MKLQRRIRLSQTGVPYIDRGLEAVNEEVARVMNGNLSFGTPATGTDNISGAWVKVVDTGNANTNFTITHNLNRVPTGFLVVNSSLATQVFQGSIAWTTTQITLQSSTAHVALTLFVL